MTGTKAHAGTMRRMVLVAAGLELLCGAAGWLLGGMMAGIAALAGACIATGAQVFAVSLLRPAMGAKLPVFQQRWVLGMAIRFGSFILLAALMIALKTTLPPAWLAAGYLATLLVLLFAETQFLK
jgi:hypothetical protein